MPPIPHGTFPLTLAAALFMFAPCPIELFFAILGKVGLAASYHPIQRLCAGLYLLQNNTAYLTCITAYVYWVQYLYNSPNLLF